MKYFIKDNKGFIIVYLVMIILTNFYLFLIKGVNIGEIIYIFLFNSIIFITFLSNRYYKTKRVYKLFELEANNIEDYLGDLGDSVIGENFSLVLNKQNLLYENEIIKCTNAYKDHLVFINKWVHQMKTPISVIQLQISENEGDEPFESMKSEIMKLNKGLNMAMFFARLDSFKKDFIIESVNLNKVIYEKINEEKLMFIKNKIKPIVNIDKDIYVYSDEKWIKFIIEQLMVNAIKYSRNKGNIVRFEVSEENNKINLSIMDEGVGIPKKDIKRVFDLFFTGTNGRNFGESTGLGLYLVKRICDELSHEINIYSEEGKGTKVVITFITNM